MFSLFIDLLLLILIANGTPVLSRKLLGDRFNQPLDFGVYLADGYRLFGPSKTWRGLLVSLLVTALVAKLMGYSLLTGLLIALFSLLGDLISSFIKRRLGRAPSTRLLILDQVPESLLPALLMANDFALSGLQIGILVGLFFILEQFMSRVMYKLGVRRKPY